MSQSRFGAALLDPDLPLPPGLTDPQGRPSPRRFGVYRNNVTVGLTEALRHSFPVIRALVGDDFFTAMAITHLRAYPPVSPLMMFYGQDMPAFLATFAPVNHLPYLPDVARLELALRHAYHAADAAPIEPARLQALAPDALVTARLRFAPAFGFLRSDWPILSIWRANARADLPPTDWHGEDILITRPEFDPEPVLLPKGAAEFVAALQSGDRIGQAFDRAPTFDLTATLSLLITGGAIVDLVTE